MKKCFYPLSAVAVIRGNSYAPGLHGNIWFVDTQKGVRVDAKIYGLPPNGMGFYGFHVHEAGSCEMPDFMSAKGHFNPDDTRHPLHAGDFPMLLATASMDATLSFVTTRFTVRDVIARSVIVHEGRDDYTSQPSGDSGRRIGCGIIQVL
ncbi:MAG: superoxide dismutase family protein [Eubacteriales bacterium]|nr:superoxide dismutase family protein [Eubacteriales bacterium]